jgi:hypothetical protein
MEEEYRMQKAKEDKRKSSIPLSNDDDSNDKTDNNESPKFENSSVKKPSQAADDSNTPVRKWQKREREREREREIVFTHPT